MEFQVQSLAVVALLCECQRHLVRPFLCQYRTVDDCSMHLCSNSDRLSETTNKIPNWLFQCDYLAKNTVLYVRIASVWAFHRPGWTRTHWMLDAVWSDRLFPLDDSLFSSSILTHYRFRPRECNSPPGQPPAVAELYCRHCRRSTYWTIWCFHRPVFDEPSAVTC